MDEFEARLREFKPRQPGPLPRPSKTRPVVWFLAAAAAAAVAFVWVQDFSPAHREVAGRNFSAAGAPQTGVVQGFSRASDTASTVGSLTSRALSDPAALDAALIRMSQTLLPDVEQPNHALSALGRSSQ